MPSAHKAICEDKRNNQDILEIDVVVQQKQITIIIEDDLTIQILEKRVVELEGYAGLTASNAEEALPLLAEQRPALVLLNLTPSGC